MTIAELFVNLGVKGTDSAGKALSGVKTGLGEVKNMSLEAKAAIIGAVYALERMMSSSAKSGTDLTNFTNLTGLSAQALQEWQYAARQVGVESEDMTGSLKGVQQAMTNMLLGKGAPEGMAMLANKVGFDATKARDTFYVMQQLQKLAQSVPPDVGNNLIKSFGVSEGVIAGMRRNAFTPEVMARAPKYSGGEIEQLDKVNVAWSNLGQKVQMAFGHFTAAHGLQLVKDIGNITLGVIKLADALTKLADKTKVFEIFSASVDGLTKLMRLAAGESLDDVMKGEKKGKRAFGQGTWWMNAIEGTQNKLQDWDVERNVLDSDAKREWRKAQGGAGGGGKAGSEVNVTQTLNFNHDGKDAQKTGDSVRKAAREAYRQSPAQAGGY